MCSKHALVQSVLLYFLLQSGTGRWGEELHFLEIWKYVSQPLSLFPFFLEFAFMYVSIIIMCICGFIAYVFLHITLC